MRHCEHLYVSLKASLQSFGTLGLPRKLLKQFAHPSVTKLYNLLKTSEHQAVTAETLRKLVYIFSTCNPYQTILTAPKRYRITMGAENSRSKAEVYIRFMFIEGAPVQHMVDDATHFCAT